MSKKIRRNQGKLIGPKFKEYLKLNFQMVRRDYGLIVCSGILMQLPHKYQPIAFIFLIFMMTWSVFKVVHVIGSKSLYQSEACLYQSFPVSAFETILAKTVVMGGAFAICGGCVVRIVGIDNLLMVPIVITGALDISGALLQAFEFGNTFRDVRKARPSMLASGILLFGWLLPWGPLVYALMEIQWDINEKLLIVLLICCFGAIAELIRNSIRLRKYYSL